MIDRTPEPAIVSWESSKVVREVVLSAWIALVTYRTARSPLNEEEVIVENPQSDRREIGENNA